MHPSATLPLSGRTGPAAIARWTPGRLVAGVVLCWFVAIVSLRGDTGFMNGEDAVMLFNYYNNIQDPLTIFFFAGYVSIVPSVVARLVASLSFTAQIVVYVTAALLFGWLFALKTFGLLSRHMPLVPAALMAAALVALVHYTVTQCYLGLVYGIWVMGLIALLMTIDLYEGRPLTMLGGVLLALCALSSPTTLTLVPFLLVWAWRSRGTQRAAGLALSLGIPLFYAVCIVLNPAAGTLDLRVGPKLAVLARQAANRPTFVADLVGIAGLAWAFVWSCPGLRGGGGGRDAAIRRAVAIAAVYGLGVVALNALSNRVVIEQQLDSRFLLPARYGLALALALLTAGSVARRAGFDWQAASARLARLGMTSGLALLLTLFVVGGKFKGPIADVSRTVAFLQDAERWRATCAGSPNGVRTLDPQDEWTLAVTCRMQPAPGAVGFHHVAEDGRLEAAVYDHAPPPSIFIGASLSDALAMKVGWRDRPSLTAEQDLGPATAPPELPRPTATE